MRWPWQKPEKREVEPFTDAVVAAIVAQASGTANATANATAALECAAGIWARAFASARVSPASNVITPEMLSLIARDLIRRGESMFLIEVRAGRVVLVPAGSWDVRGGWNPASWKYRLDLFGPSGNVTKFVSAASVLHFRYAFDPARPWHGLGPLAYASSTGALLGNLERTLSQEAGGPVGNVVPVPADGGDGSDNDNLSGLKTDIANLKGGTALVETTQAGFDTGRSAAPQQDWQAKRIGANPPQVLQGLRSDAGMAVLSACGVPVSLMTDADGTSQRESWRRFVMGSIEPVSRCIAAELQDKLELQDVEFDFTSLWAHDLQGRAVAFQKLVAGGVPVNEALVTSGLLVKDA